MTTEPKLLTEAERLERAALFTEAEWLERIAAWGASEHAHHILADLHERGLIAREPVDPLMKQAVELVDLWLPDETELRHEAIDLALAALRRGMELAPRKTLTREMVIAAVHSNVTGESYAINYSAIHAALQEALQ